MTILSKTKNCLFSILGIICIIFSEKITAVLPYLIGGAMMLIGTLMIAAYIRSKKFLEPVSKNLVYGTMMAIMGISFLIKGKNAIGALGTTWAIIGIINASESLGLAIENICLRKKYAAFLAEFIVRITLALILLFNPFEKFSFHVMILGLELIFSSIPFSLPCCKK